MARPIRTCRSGNPPPGGVSPVCPAPGTNGDVLVAVAGEVDGDVDGEVDGDVDGEVDGDVDGEVDGDVDGEVDGDVDGEVDGLVGGVVGVHVVLLMVSCALPILPVKLTVATAVFGMSKVAGVAKKCIAPLPWPPMNWPVDVVSGAPFLYVTTSVPLMNVPLPPDDKIQWYWSVWPDGQDAWIASSPFLPSQVMVVVGSVPAAFATPPL
jgi:hypothetical protein